MIVRNYITVLALVSWVACGLAQEFNFRNYSVGDGLAQSQVFDLIEDQRGYIWLGTRGGGLCRFDGREFQAFTSRDSGLVNNYILSLYETEDGRIWIGTNNGLSIYNGSLFYNFLSNDTVPVSVSTFLEDISGIVWLGTSQGIFQMTADTLLSFSEQYDFYPKNVSCIYQDQEGLIWIGHDEGLTRIRRDTLTTFTRRSGLRKNQVRSVIQDSSGTFWVGTYSGGVHTFDGKRFYPAIQQGALYDGLIFDMAFDRDGKLWIATQNTGVAVWDKADSSLTILNEYTGLANNHVRAILEDSWGNHWFGTSGGGVSKYFGQLFTHYDQRSGLPGKQVYSLWQDYDCNIWMGVADHGLAVFDGKSFSGMDASAGFKNIKAKALYEDATGRIWVGTEGQGISMLEDSVWTEFDGTDGLSGNWIRDIIGDHRGNIWVATAGGGITRVEEKVDSLGPDSIRSTFRFFPYTTRQGLSQTRINDLHEDNRGRIWFATNGSGIGYIEHDTSVVNIRLEGGLQENSVRSLTEDVYGYLWVGTAGGGVSNSYIYQDSVPFSFLNQREQLTSGNIYLLTFDQEDHLWIGNEKGMDRATLNQERNIIDVKHFGKSEGFMGIETTQNAVLRDRDGNLWIGTMNGLTHYNPSTSIRNPKPPILSMNEIRLFYGALRDTKYGKWVDDWALLKSGLELPHNQNHLGFDFIAIDHNNPEKVAYQWKLEGWEDDWTPVTNKTDATYSNLPPGSYTFKVRARNGDGVWNEQPLTVETFTILPPFWETWWFIVAAIASGVILMLIIFTLRINQVKRKARQERERLEMEKGLLELEQKALRLQMNPHFIFNALNSIQGMIVLKDTKTARYFLAKFSRLMRQVLENSREALIPLSEEIQTLENYLSLEQFSRGESFDFQIHVDEKIDPDEFMIPPMLLQPFVENAIIHGVAHLSGQKGMISIKFRLEGAQIICTIHDNGIGREKAAKINSQQRHNHKSTALLVTQERLDILNPSAGKSIAIRDLAAADGSPAGTEVEVRVPQN